MFEREDIKGAFREADCTDYEAAYDPFADDEDDFDEDDRAELYGYIGDPGMLAPKTQLPDEPERSVPERFDDLISSMPPFKSTFFDILNFCDEPKSISELEAFVDDIHSRKSAVYSATSYCAMLASAGALEKIDAEGKPYVEPEPEFEEITDDEGNTFVSPVDPPEAFWCTTEEGRAYRDAYDPLAEMKTVFEKWQRYASVYEEILCLCEGDEGCSIGEIRSRVNKNPVLASPPKTAQFFMDHLDRTGALKWDGAWKITPMGREFLASLREQADCA